ncbi:diguanylate cyclase/phosphodiesterase (GGDEF & EAL domains) with PAS/PAC sensor(s) [hydrothermal vent metagenome]|uniref:Diguanylate cyclase/phosphodiesterase (GGDEF & EAL domains) with PAS/PAC sensor(S) n=1 Tax=hydrothermal vent metagenome TaxID=652676 RepID=A0A3B0W5S7_9ZZZZ
MVKIITEIRQLKRNMTIRYMIAITLVVLFSIAAFLSMDVVVKGMDKNTYLVNMSGKQRLLSQYVALDAYRLYSSKHIQLYDEELELIKERLRRNLAEMTEINDLFSQSIEGEKTTTLSLPLSRMYVDELNLKFRVQQYLALVRLVLDLPDYGQKKIILDIERFSNGLLEDLDKIVLQLQKEGGDRLQKIKDTKFFLLLLTLLVLALEVLFIFIPMVNRIVFLTQKKAVALEDLERQVTLRTRHLEKLNKKLDQLAHHDALTGLRNRLDLEANIEKVIVASEKNKTEFAVLMLDMDWFKSVNDQYGHDVGDFVLRELAQILTQSVREGDHVYRAGGEEFVVLLNRLSYKNAKQKAENIRQAVAEHVFSANGVRLHKTLSGGLYHSSLVNVSGVKELLKLTDSALYAAKHAGRNKIIEVREDMLSGLSAFNSVHCQIVFSDLQFDQILALDEDVLKLTGYGGEDFRSGKIKFIDLLLSQDRNILKKITLNSSKESPFVSPIRLHHQNGREVPVRLEAYTSYQHKTLEVIVNLEGYMPKSLEHTIS